MILTTMQPDAAHRDRQPAPNVFVRCEAIGEMLRGICRPGRDDAEPIGPGAFDWLSAAEKTEMAHWRNPRRRRQWLAARRLAKAIVVEAETAGSHASSDMSNDAAAELEILSLDAAGRSVAPAAWRCGIRVPGCLSIAHTERYVASAYCPVADVRIGVDLVEDVALGPEFIAAWFTEAEQRYVAQHGIHRAAQIWAAKEAAYKATGDGEPFVPRHFEIAPRDDNSWSAHCRRSGRVIVVTRVAGSPAGSTTAIALVAPALVAPVLVRPVLVAPVHPAE